MNSVRHPTADALLARTALVPELSPLSQGIVAVALVASIAFVLWLVFWRKKA